MKKRWLAGLVSLLVILAVGFMGCNGSGGDTSKTDYDIIVAGAGIAGMSAALRAAVEAPDLSILLIEKESTYGGLTIRSAGSFSDYWARADSTWEDADKQYSWVKNKADWIRGYRNDMRWSSPYENEPADLKLLNDAPDGPYPNYDKTYLVASETRKAVNWLIQNGMGGRQEKFYDFVGGRGRLDPMWEAIQKIPNITTKLNSKAIGLLYKNTTPTKTVTGVKIDFGGTIKDVTARKVILATGGLSQNQELMTKYSGSEYGGLDFSDLRYHNVQDFKGSTGDGVLMALAVGAEEYKTVYVSPGFLAHDPELLGIHPALLRYNETSNWDSAFMGDHGDYSENVIVDSKGVRWRPEDAFGYYITCWLVYNRGKIAPQPVYVIYSEAQADRVSLPIRGQTYKLGEVFNAIDAATGDQLAAINRRMVRGSSLDDLAGKLLGSGTSEATAFVKMIKDYDAAVKKARAGGGWKDPGEGSYFAQVNHYGTMKDLPGKVAGNNNANLHRFGKDNSDGSIDYNIKFYAMAAKPSIFDSFAGVASDIYGRVLTRELAMTSDWPNPAWELEGKPDTIIKNLYGIGSVSNRDYFGYHYHGGAALSSGATMGTRAALHAVEAIKAGN